MIWIQIIFFTLLRTILTLFGIVIGLFFLIFLFLIFNPLYITIIHTTERFGKLFRLKLSWGNGFIGLGLYSDKGDWYWKFFRQTDKTVKIWDIDEEARRTQRERAKKVAQKAAPTPKFAIKETFVEFKVVKTFIKRFLKTFALKKLKWECYYGFNDPAWTGATFGWVQALKAMIPNKRIVLRFQPEFLNPGYEGNVKLTTAFYPYIMIWAFFPFVGHEIKLQLKKLKQKIRGKKKVAVSQNS